MFWPFVPVKDGYSTEPIEKMRSTATAGGFPRDRAILQDGTTLITCTFVFSTPNDYNTFQKFWQAYQQRPQWFRIKLVTDMTDPVQRLTMHNAQVVPGSFTLNRFGGHRWEVGMQLEAYQL